MSGPTPPDDLAACLALAQRQVGDASEWTAEQWQAQLAEDSLALGNPPKVYYRPYRSAMAYLLRPDRVKARTEGSISEQYVDVAETVKRLRELDSEWEAHRLPSGADEVADGGTFDGAITWGSW